PAPAAPSPLRDRRTGTARARGLFAVMQLRCDRLERGGERDRRTGEFPTDTVERESCGGEGVGAFLSRARGVSATTTWGSAEPVGSLECRQTRGPLPTLQSGAASGRDETGGTGSAGCGAEDRCLSGMSQAVRSRPVRKVVPVV